MHLRLRRILSAFIAEGQALARDVRHHRVGIIGIIRVLISVCIARDRDEGRDALSPPTTITDTDKGVDVSFAVDLAVGNHAISHQMAFMSIDIRVE